MEVDVHLFLIVDDQSGLEGSLGPFDVIAPNHEVPHLVNSELLAKTVVT